MSKPVITVLFSCGAASAVAAYMTKMFYGHTHTIRIVNNPVKEEDEDNRRFLYDVSVWLDQEIINVRHPKYADASAVEVWVKNRYMSGVKGAPCTKFLKKEARQIDERTNPTDFIVLGFTVEEKKRHENFVLSERSDVLPVLIQIGFTKQMCFDFLASHGLSLPRIYSDGYPNANCIGCVKATSPTYWNHVRRRHPKEFWDRAILSRKLGVRLVRVGNQRMFLDELPPDLIGRPMKSLVMPECGIFCEEKVIK